LKLGRFSVEFLEYWTVEGVAGWRAGWWWRGEAWMGVGGWGGHWESLS
jgi:hypothetical protein